MYLRHGKRILDLLIAVPLLILVAPVMGIVALTILLATGRPIFFRQERPGYQGRPFMLLKFRTMTTPAESSVRPLTDAERLTALGKFLRSTSLDELPELWNVLKGQMSLVGPRPLLMQYLGLYTGQQRRRHDVRPGITGWAQVNGRNAISWQERFRYDIWYTDHVSLWIDLRILLATVSCVIRRYGVHAQGEVTMPEFTGNS